MPETGARPVGMGLPRAAWVKLNRLRTGVGRFHSSMHKWGLALSPNCECGSPEQTTDHVLTACPIHRAPRGARGLMVLDDETLVIHIAVNNNNLQVGDKVLLKQNESNNMWTVCHKDPFMTIERKGNCLTVQNGDMYLKRNITHVKKCNPCTNVCDYSRNYARETHDSDSKPDHANSDCENNVENDVNAKCLRLEKFLNNQNVFIIE